MSVSERFQEEKLRILNSPDLSPKGSWDSQILHILNLINSLPNYVTTSSCSGRVVVFTNVYPKTNGSKKHKCCTVLYKDHQSCLFDSVKNSLLSSDESKEFNDIQIKYEGLIIHIQCENLEYAKRMLNCGMDAGLRNSGIIPSKMDNQKFILVLRSNIVLETPLKCGGKVLASDEYLGCLTDVINKKMDKNHQIIQKFENNLRSCFKDL